MPEPWDQPIPGLDKPDTGVPVDEICRGRVQACPRCGDPVVWAFTLRGAAPEAIAVEPIVDQRGNGILTEKTPGGTLWVTFVTANNQPDEPRHFVHVCPNPRPAPTRRRRPNGPTAR